MYTYFAKAITLWSELIVLAAQCLRFPPRFPSTPLPPGGGSYPVSSRLLCDYYSSTHLPSSLCTHFYPSAHHQRVGKTLYLLLLCSPSIFLTLCLNPARACPGGWRRILVEGTLPPLCSNEVQPLRRWSVDLVTYQCCKAPCKPWPPSPKHAKFTNLWQFVLSC